MKKNRFYLLAALATTAFSLSSCIYDDEVASFAPNSGLSQDEIKVAAVMQGVDASTRAAYNLQSENLYDWTKAGIFVYKTGNTAAVSASTGVTGYAGYENIGVQSPSTGATKPTASSPLTLTPVSKLYFPVDNTDVDVYVYAPYDAAYSTSPDVTAMDFTVKGDQAENADYYDSDFIYGMATADYDAATDPKTAKVTMYHALTKMTFKITEDGANASGITDISLLNVFKTAEIDMSAPIVASPTSGDPYLNNGTNVNVTTDNTATRGNVVVAHYDGATGTHTTNFYSAAKSDGVSAIIPPHSTADLQDSSNSNANPVKVSVTIDGKTKTVDVYQASGTGALTELLPGFEYVFNLKIKATEVIVVVVSIVDWQTQTAVDRDLTF